MKNMKNILILMLVLLLQSCGGLQVSTMGHDPIYSIEGSDAKVTVINSGWELDRLLRDDFNFRYDFAQYALSQPMSFDWNIRLNRFTQFNRFNRSNYNYRWNRSQMWNDWVWGYPYNNGIGWTYNWNNNRWNSNGWNTPYNWNGWSNVYGYNSWHQINGIYGRRQNTSNVNGRRTSNISTRRGISTVRSTRIVKNNTIKVIKPIIKKTRRNRVIIKPVIKPVRNNRVIKPIRRNNNTNRNIRSTPVRNVRRTSTSTRRSSGVIKD